MSIEGIDLTNRHVVLDERIVLPKYRDIRYRVWYCLSGPGCRPDGNGCLLRARHVVTHDEWWLARTDIERVATSQDIEAAMREADGERNA